MNPRGPTWVEAEARRMCGCAMCIDGGMVGARCVRAPIAEGMRAAIEHCASECERGIDYAADGVAEAARNRALVEAAEHLRWLAGRGTG